MKNKAIFRGMLVANSIVCSYAIGYAQNDNSLDLPAKVKHIEPLYVDLIRDLGARKGEKELNLAGDFTNTKSYGEYAVLAEYEFAPVNRLGLEIETDFSFYKSFESGKEIPRNKLDNVRLSAQYSFFVSPKYKTTLAIAYTQVFNLADFSSYDSSQFITGMVYSPFFIAAKNWGNNFYTLLLTGPLFVHDFHTDYTTVDWQINPSVHYGIPNTSHFVGIEFNTGLVDHEYEVTMRPQGKIQINEVLALGIVAGFPLTKSEEKFSSFFRVIYELE